MNLTRPFCWVSPSKLAVVDSLLVSFYSVSHIRNHILGQFADRIPGQFITLFRLAIGNVVTPSRYCHEKIYAFIARLPMHNMDDFQIIHFQTYTNFFFRFPKSRLCYGLPRFNMSSHHTVFAILITCIETAK